MKKLFIIFTALMAVALFTAPSFAGGTVQMTLTSPTIYKQGCEKFGATTYSFQQNSTIKAGDWWYMDLPENVALCKSYNYIIAGRTVGSPTLTIPTTGVNPYMNVAFVNGNVSTPLYIGVPVAGPLTVTGGVAGTGVTLTPNGNNNMAFLVKGTSGSRRITVYALTEGRVGTANPETLTVGVDTQLNFNLFDGQPHSTETTLDKNTCILLPGTAAGTTNVYTTPIANPFPAVENTLCANAENYTTQYVYTSYASKDDSFTFSGDSQIAHTGTSEITLVSCTKTATIPDVLIGTDQDVCAFDYETSGTTDAYCSSTYWNRFIVRSETGSFGSSSDQFFVTAEITSPATGVYFAAGPGVMSVANGVDACASPVVATTATTPFVAGLDSSNVASGGFPGTSTCSGIDATKKAKYADGSAATFAIPATHDQLYVNFSSFVFDRAVVSAAQEITVKLQLNKSPCGTIFSGSRTIGSFVTTCPTVSATTLYYPWLPGTGAPAGWWGGYTLTNVDSSAGTATVTLRDSAGNSASFTTASIVPGQLVVLSQLVASATLTQADANNPYDPALNYSVVAVCTFGARGFAFTGDATQGVGYTADR